MSKKEKFNFDIAIIILAIMLMAIGLHLQIEKIVDKLEQPYVVERTVNYNYTTVNQFKSTRVNLSCPKPVISSPPQTIIYTSHLQKIISSVCEERGYESDDDYKAPKINKDRWVCEEMSKEGVSRLKNAGYTGFKHTCGWYDNGKVRERHCWAEWKSSSHRMIIEFSKQCIIVPPIYYEYYKSD